jgi:cell filamentation protein
VSDRTTDPYLEPGTGVLRNRLGITTARELAAVEAALSASRLIDLEQRRLPGDYDLGHLRAFHHYIFGDVYDWAGELRTVSIAKGSVFCLPQHLQTYGREMFDKLTAANQLRGLARDQFVTRLTEFLGDLNALHPFREGNGRTQRAFVSQLAHDAGHHIEWVRMDPEQNRAAGAASLHGQLAPLRVMLDELVDPPHPHGPGDAPST